MDGDVTYAELRFPPSVGSRRTQQAEQPPDAKNKTLPEKAGAKRSSLWMCSAVLLGILCLLLVILSIALGLLLLAKKETTNEYDDQKEYAERLRQFSDQFQELNKTMNETKVKLDQATAALNQTTAALNQTKADLHSFKEKIQHLEAYKGRRWYCPERWTSVNGKCYYVSPITQDWLSSLEYCIARDAHLAIFSDTTILNSLRSRSEFFWVGSMYNNRRFVWYNSSAFLSLMTFRDSYYRVCAEGERCGVASIRKAALDFAYCTSELPWICEKPAVQLHVDEALLPPSVFVNSVKYVSIP